MKVSTKTLEVLNDLILGSESFGYKKGYQLVEFFNKFGLDDKYDQNFPSRFTYSLDKLKELNQNDEIQNVICEYFDPINFIDNPDIYNENTILINKYLIHDNLKLIRVSNKVKLINIAEENQIVNTDSDLKRIWGDEECFKIFLSHKSEFKIQAKILKDKLAVFGISCFVAHEDIEPTKEWQNEIEKALFSADT